MIEYLLIVIGALCCIVGFLGSFLPILPGLPISWVGLLLIYLIPGMHIDYVFLGITLGVTILLLVLGYVIPAQGTKRFGGSKAGAIGTTVGLVVGIFIPIPLGILWGPFVGALIGELVFNKTESKQAFKAAFGSFVGFLAGTFINVLTAFVFICLFVYQLFNYSDIIFK